MPSRSWRRRSASRAVMLTITGFSLYLIAPSILEVFSSWDQVAALQARWLIGAGLAQVVAFAFVWALQRLALRTTAWFPVITSQLGGNAAARLIPGAAATGAAVQYRMLRTAGVSTANASSGLAAAGIIQLAVTFAMPLVAVVAALAGVTVPDGLWTAAWGGAILFVGLMTLSYFAFTGDRLLRAAGTAVDAIRRWTPGLAAPDQPTATALLTERDALRDGLGGNWGKAALFATGRALFDYLSLVTALKAFGSDASLTLVLLAFTAAAVLGMIPLTPGGLGFVEAGLTGTLVLAGVSPSDSVSATMLYRLVSFWLPIPIGVAAGVIHRVRFGNDEADLATE